jgi:hypothetical protein
MEQIRGQMLCGQFGPGTKGGKVILSGRVLDVGHELFEVVPVG